MTLDIEMWDITRPTPYARNPRDISDAAVAKVAGSLKEFGWRQPIVVDREGVIVAGHTRLLAAMRLGMTQVPVHVARDLTPAQAKAYRLTDNRVGEESAWNNEMLSLELADLSGLDVDLGGLGFDADELADLLADKTDGLTDPDEVPDPPVNPVSRLGDVWLLGRHRICCGDGTNLETVAHLTGGVTPDLANCDPPYGINVVKGATVGGANLFGRVHGPSRNAITCPNTYAPIIGDDTTDTAIASHAMLVALKVPVIVLWGGNYFAAELPRSRCWLVWDKENTGTFADAELAWTNQDKVVKLFRHQWSGLVKASERGERRVHPTQKPVALADWVIETMAPKAKTVIDLFLGSGSTLISAERAGLTLFGTELSPAYADVAVRRWQAFTGQSATLESTDQTFDEVMDERIGDVANPLVRYDDAVAAVGD